VRSTIEIILGDELQNHMEYEGGVIDDLSVFGINTLSSLSISLSCSIGIQIFYVLALWSF
jgi:hypothetical protein